MVLSSVRRPGRTWSTGHPPGACRRCILDRQAVPAHTARLGAEEGLSSSQDHLLAVQRPLRRRVLGHLLQVPGVLSVAFAFQVRARLSLGPPFDG
jgi:hypothetical protein